MEEHLGDGEEIRGRKACPLLHGNGEGIHHPFTQEVHWAITSVWTNDGALLPLRSESSYSDARGLMLSRETRKFDWSRNQVQIDKTDPKTNRTTTQTIKIPPDTLSVDGIAWILRGLDLSRTSPFNAHLLTNEPKVYEISLEVRGKAKVLTKDGVVDGYKVELVPHLGILSPLRVFYPKAYFWFRADSEHTWLRYEGLENGPGSPEISLEMH